MFKLFLIIIMAVFLTAGLSEKTYSQVQEENAAQEVETPVSAQNDYIIGPDDVLEVNILKPEVLEKQVTVAPDGSINYPYIGTVHVKGLTIEEVQKEIQNKLADGYMKYPVVAVYLNKSLSKKFFVYGEVIKPGPYPMDESMTVLKAISSAGGFTKFGSSSRVKILRSKPNKKGYQVIEVNVRQIIKGNTNFDIELVPGDIVVVSEGIF